MKRDITDDLQVTWYRGVKYDVRIKVALGVFQQFFFSNEKHNNYFQIKQFSKVDIKQNNVSTLNKICAISKKLRCLHFCLHNKVRVLSNF